MLSLQLRERLPGLRDCRFSMGSAKGGAEPGNDGGLQVALWE